MMAMSIQIRSQHNRRLVFVMVVLNIIALACYLFVFIEVKRKNEHVSSLANEIEVKSTAESVEHSAKALVAETASLRSKLQGFVVGSEDAVSFIEMLEVTARDIGAEVTINSVTPGNLDNPSIESLRLVLKIEGTWSEVIQYLGLLELLPFQSTVEEVTVSLLGERSSDPWRADATLVVLKEKTL